MILHWQSILLYCFYTAAAIQLVFILGIHLRFAFYRKPKSTTQRQHAVSVVICARDEAQNITDNLPLLLQQQYPSTYEVIAVNDNSFDDSKYVLEYLSKAFRHLRPIELHQEAPLIQGKKFPLSIGIKEAKYELLLLTDADCRPASALWIEHMQNGFREGKEIVLGYGPYEKTPGLLNKLIRFETFHAALQYFSFALAGIPYMGVGRNLAYKKEVFLRNKGFSQHNQLPGGDDDLFINRVAGRKNTAIVIDRESFMYSKPKSSWKTWRQQKTRHYSTSRYYKPVHQFLLGTFSLTHFLFYPLLIFSFFLTQWWIPVSIYGSRLLLQGLVYFRSMRKLDEQDLFFFYPLLDLWQWFYYLLFADTLFRKPQSFWK